MAMAATGLHDKTVIEFQITMPDESRKIVQAVARSIIGNGRSTLFCEYRWMVGFRIQEVAPDDRVDLRARGTHTVYQAIFDGAWASNIGPDLLPRLLQDYLSLWTQLMAVHLDQGAADAVSWGTGTEW